MGAEVIQAGVERRGALLWWILGLALVARLVVMMFLSDQQFPDAGSYRTSGAEFRHLHMMTNTDIMPLYPLLIAIVGDGWGQKLADLAWSVASVWLAYALALRIYRNEAVALAAAFACALWPHFVFFAAVGLTETMFIALVLAALVSLHDERYALGSVFLVLSILTRPALEPFAPIVVLLFALVVHRQSLRFSIARLAIYALIYVSLMAPWWAHNYVKYGEFVRLNVADGMVLYTGNNPSNTSGGGITGPDVDFAGFRKIENPVRRSEAFRNAAVEYIKSDPWHFVAMMGVKFGRLWRPWPHVEDYRSSLIVAVSVATFLPALVLALVGLAATLRSHFHLLLPSLAYMAFLTLVHMVTFGSVRYRVPMEPIVLILAAAGGVVLLRQFAAGRTLLTRLAPAGGA